MFIRTALSTVLLLSTLWSGPPSDGPFLVVLGIAQDGGVPQLGSNTDPAWENASATRRATSLAIVDPGSEKRWLIEATPDLKMQLHDLDKLATVAGKPGLDGIFLTHAHIGHYLGLAQLGHEALGASRVPVYAMPRMQEFLRTNGPWDQLVRYHNIELHGLQDGLAVRLNTRVTVTPFPVPHRQEYSEVVGFRISSPRRSVLFLPDIDSWQEWDRQGGRIEDLIRSVDVAYLDGTFFADGEIPGRDMSGFLHPFITTSMARFTSLSVAERNKIRFIHLNHTNPALRHGSSQRRQVEQAGFHIAEELERVEL